jgi:hypothetical protein
MVRNKANNKTKVKREGAVEQFAEYLNRSERSNYFKWVIANHLAKLNLKIRHQYNGNPERENKENSEMVEDDKTPVEKYFSAGLNNSFMEYHKKKKFYKSKNGSPFDIELDEVIHYLESQLEIKK